MSTGCWCRPSGELPVADLRALVSMPVDAVHACRCALVFEAPQLLDVASVWLAVLGHSAGRRALQ